MLIFYFENKMEKIKWSWWIPDKYPPGTETIDKIWDILTLYSIWDDEVDNDLLEGMAPNLQDSLYVQMRAVYTSDATWEKIKRELKIRELYLDLND